MSTESEVLKGVFPVIPTLFNKDNEIDVEAQKNVVRFALENGAAAVVCPAVASEYNFLSLEERAFLVALVTKEVNGKVPIIGGASAQTVSEVVAAGRSCLEAGIKHLMIMAPFGLGSDLQAHKDFFSEICQQLNGAQIILQNAPTPIGAGLDVESIIELVKSCEMITYVKEETLPSGPAITAITNSHIPHLKGVIGGGGSRYMIDELDRGALGAMPAVEIIDLHVAIYREHLSGNHEKARKLYRDSLPILVSQLIYRMRLTKYVLDKRGIVNDVVVRAPLPEMDSYTKDDIDRMLFDLQASFV
jgi:4-hydroxy-tetrahydrodipicolinate synthase